MRYVSAIPAYGRDYETEEEVLRDWQDHKDFRIQDLILHGYISKCELPDDMTICIRYNKQQEVCVIPDPEHDPLTCKLGGHCPYPQCK